MALVVFLRGINVGGHRRFRPSELARHLRRFDAVNVGAAGTLVVHGTITRTRLRAELARQLPFDAYVMICGGAEIRRLVAVDQFAAHRPNPRIVQFVSVLARRAQTRPSLPARIPAAGKWYVNVLASHGRFVLGLHRREMRAITHLGQLDRLFGVRATTRSWSTMQAIGRALDG